MAQFIGSSGTLVASALETVGYYYQSYILDVLSTPFGGSDLLNTVALYIYTFGIFGVLIGFVFTQKVKTLSWLIIAPGIFTMVMTNRTETTGVMWKYGSETRNVELVRQEISKQINPNRPARVSSLFAWYTGFTGNIVNGIVTIINGTRKNLDIQHVVKAELVNRLNTSPAISNVGLNDLIHSSFMNNCSTQLDKAANIVKFKNSPYVKNQNVEEYKRDMSNQSIELKDQARDYAITLFATYPILKRSLDASMPQTTTQNGQQNTGVGIGNIFQSPVHNGTQTTFSADEEEARVFDKGCYSPNPKPECNDAKNTLLSNFINLIKQRNIEVNRVLATVDNRTKLDAVQLRNSITSLPDYNPVEVTTWLNNRRFSCSELWFVLYSALHIEALNELGETVSEAKAVGMTENQFLSELSRLTIERDPIRRFEAMSERDKLDNQSVIDTAQTNQVLARAKLDTLLVRSIAKRIFRVEMQDKPLSSLLSRYTYGNVNQKFEGIPADYSKERTELKSKEELEEAKKSLIIQYAFNLPYYQGMGLMFLAIIFPFFSLLLLIPERFTSFSLWFLLWFWIKSWDIGFAVVLMLEDVLFSIFSAKNYDPSITKQEILDPSALVAFNSLRYSDPTFNMTTYYIIVGLSLSAIPIITSYLVLKSAKYGAGLISSGLKDLNSEQKKFGSSQGSQGVTQSADQSGGSLDNRINYFKKLTERQNRALRQDQGELSGLSGFSGADLLDSLNSGSLQTQYRSKSPFSFLSKDGVSTQTLNNIIEKMGFAQGTLSGMDTMKGYGSFKKEVAKSIGSLQKAQKQISDVLTEMNEQLENAEKALNRPLNAAEKAQFNSESFKLINDIISGARNTRFKEIQEMARIDGQVTEFAKYFEMEGVMFGGNLANLTMAKDTEKRYSQLFEASAEYEKIYYEAINKMAEQMIKFNEAKNKAKK